MGNEIRTLTDDIQVIEKAKKWSINEIPQVVSAKTTLQVVCGLSFQKPDKDTLFENKISIIGAEGGLYNMTTIEDRINVFLKYGILPEGPLADIISLASEEEALVVQYNFGGDLAWVFDLQTIEEAINQTLDLDKKSIILDEMTAEMLFKTNDSEDDSQ